MKCSEFGIGVIILWWLLMVVCLAAFVLFVGCVVWFFGV